MGRPLLPLLVVAAMAALSCGDDGTTTGFRDECAHASGTLLGCDPIPVETPKDACWKLVECAVLPLESENQYDWGQCVRDVERMRTERQSFYLECVDVARCDDLEAGLCGPYGQE